MTSLQAQLSEIDQKMVEVKDTIEGDDTTQFLFQKATLLKNYKEHKQAIAMFKEVIEKTKSFNLKMDSVFEILHIGVLDKDLSLMKENISLCKKLLERGGDWEKRNKLKVHYLLRCTRVFAICLRETLK